ncbi:MAG: hypothetical protein DRI95_10310 [Bacteroidetes bacterium]|nr:MAG: hypothetical protein DRI95_10310 [Bacteroidota bacterium]
MLYHKGLTLVAFILITGLNFLYSQTESVSNKFSKEDIIDLAEKKYGLDDLLINGGKYRPKDIRVNGNLFFEWAESTDTKLFIKGQTYFNTKLKYDINSDRLVLTTVTKDSYEHLIVLNSSLVDSFYLGHHIFINMNQQKENSNQKGYFEKINSGNDILLKKYTKTIISLYDDYNPNGKYSSQKYTYFIYNHKDFVKVSSKKAFLKFYETYRKEIGKFMKQNEIVYKSASNEELIKLMTFCHAKSTQAN